jgi:hypothetical protein
MIALAPHDHAVFPAARVNLGLGLAPQTGVHHLHAADGARVALHVPAPHCHCVPFLQREHASVTVAAAAAVAGCSSLLMLRAMLVSLLLTASICPVYLVHNQGNLKILVLATCL